MSAVEGLDLLSPDLLKELRALEEQFHVDTAKLQEISQRFEQELKDGLAKHGSNISMNVTWVVGFPAGTERGSFLTIDLGGTNLRVCWITLRAQEGETEVNQHSYRLPKELKTGSAEALWSFIADSLAEFIRSQKLEATEDDPLPLGFTFSYPALQDYIDHGKLQTWTKGFDIDGVEGEDVASQLREAMEKRALPVKLVVLINDTVGAMIASAYNDPETIVGAIFGTGCNAAYMDDVGSIAKLQTVLGPGTPMAINCEYGAFDNSLKVLPRTKYDDIIDRESPRPREQAFEKMSAGLYLGELFRLILCDLHDRGLIFKGQNVSKLREPYLLDTGFLSSMEDDPFAETRSRYEAMLNIQITWEELQLSHRLAEVIAERGARLCTCGISAICRMKGIKSGHVAADGSVANKHPKFKARWAHAMGEVLGWPEDRTEDPITITSAEDGSGIGAAVIAAMTLERIEKGETAGIRQS
ncbi:hypothetical protein LTR53_010913 [Teratosphaeriaceae sp. CCFEE 6253]|nr:hypothetical protein LTR53_010913 [Teratosphaeriaceae sp. CCFEE 6253]